MNPRIRNELLASGFLMFASMIIFYAIDPLAQREIIVKRGLKIVVYCTILLSFNLWMRATNRINGVDPYGDKAMKEHIKFSMFILAMFQLMDLANAISRI